MKLLNNIFSFLSKLKKKDKEPIGKEFLTFKDANINKVEALIEQYNHIKTTFEGITVHNNGNPDSKAIEDVNWALKGEDEVSWHYSVDQDEVVRFLSVKGDYTCFASGDGRYGFGNSKTINIEICEHDGWDNNESEAWLKSRLNSIHLIAHLLYIYNLDISTVKQHNDRDGKDCPRIIRRDGFEEYIKEINDILVKIKNR